MSDYASDIIVDSRMFLRSDLEAMERSNLVESSGLKETSTRLTAAAAMYGRRGYETLEGGVNIPDLVSSMETGEDLNVETALDIAGEVQIIEPRKFRFKPTARVPTWPLMHMPHTRSGIRGTVGRSCVVTALAVKGKWLKVRVRGGKEGWMQSEYSDGRVVLSECESYRRHEEWGGRNQFFAGGKIMLGSDVRWFVCSNITLTVPVSLFTWEIMFGFPIVGSRVLAWVAMALWGVAVLNLWITAMTDPGIIPPNPSEDRAPPPEGESIGLHGFKYCETCNIFRPPRSKHCNSCNNCVDRFDHHCPWVGSCVAVRNYRFFLMFVSTTTVLIIYMLVVLVLRVVIRVVMGGDGSVPKALEIVASDPMDIVLIIMAFVVGMPLLRLWWYHVQTILCKGQTTNEDIRGVYRNHPNNYNQGCAKNSYTLLWASRPRSRLPDLSELIYVKEPVPRRHMNPNPGLFSWIYPAGSSGFSRVSLRESDEHPRPEAYSGVSGRWSSSGGGSFTSCAEGEFPTSERGWNSSNNASNAAGGVLGAVSGESPEARVSSSEAVGASTSPPLKDAGQGEEEAKGFDGSRGANPNLAESGAAGIIPEGTAAAWKRENGSPSAQSSSPLVGLAFTSSPRSAFDLDASGNGSVGGSSCEGPQAGDAPSPLGVNARAGGAINSAATMGSTRADGDAGGSHSSGELWYLANSLSSAAAPASAVSPERVASGAGPASVLSDYSRSARSFREEGSRRERGHAGNPEEFTMLLSEVNASETTPSVGLDQERNPRYGGVDSDARQPRAAFEGRYQGSALPS